jgi:alcohol dehydrogenase (cytochrome c)
MARGTGAGALLYTNSTLALNPDTGKIVWHFQHLPRDNWNLDHAFERVLVDAQLNGKSRRLVLTLGKTGIVTALDRETGEWVWSTQTVHQNVISRIDPRTGAVTLNEEVIPRKLNADYLICPSFYGGKIWQTTAYHPATNALYVPLANMCMNFKVVEQEPTPGEDYGRGRLTARHAPKGNGMVGRIDAIDAATGRRLWKHERRTIVSSSLLTTAGGLVIGGDASRRLVILDARSGTVLVEKPLNAAVSGFPMTYMVDGKQYLAIPTGTNMLAQFSSPLTPENRVPSDRKPGNGSALLVFALPDTH